MGLFRGIKKIFNKSISIMPYQRPDMVSFVKLKNGILKMGTELIVDENYHFVVVHYNRVCDILIPGTHKINEVTVPKLFKYSKAFFTRRGWFTANGIRTDAYYVNLMPFKLNTFRTPERIVVFGKNNEKLKINLEGTFTLTVVNSGKLMKALCRDYAVVSNKKALKEIRNTIGFDVSKILNEKKFKLDDFLINRQKIIDTLNIEIERYVEMYGLKISDFFISSVILRKKNIIDKTKEEVLKQEESNDEIVKMVEERLNSLENEFKKVEVTVDGKKTIEKEQSTYNKVDVNDRGDVVINIYDNKEFKPEEQKPQEDIFNMPFNSGVGSFSTTSNEKEPSLIQEDNEIKVDEKECNITIENKKVKMKDLFATPNENKQNNGAKTKKCKNCGTNIDSVDKFCSKCGKNVEDLIVCPCCGAKNFENAKVCCVCKSELK